MDYNTQREALIIPEYGRNIQNMVKYACTIEDRDERNTCAQAIIKVMGQLNPHLRDVEEFKPKLWAHLFIMSRFTLDVDSPYPRPEPETFLEKPRPVKYPANNIRYKHYGRTVELLIAKASVLEPGEEQTAFAITIANMMKKSYIGYNRDSVEDSVILDALARMSDGVLQLDMNTQLISTQEILRTNNLAKKNVSGGGKSNKKKKKKR